LVFADTRANAEKTKRAVFCQRTDRKTNFEIKNLRIEKNEFRPIY
jgi:hypothetical protein